MDENFIFLGNVKGKDGNTPVKGVDYWTEEDKEEIIGEVKPYTVTGNITWDFYQYKFSNMSATYEEIKTAIEKGKNVTLKLRYTNADKYIYADFTRISTVSGNVNTTSLDFLGMSYMHSDFNDKIEPSFFDIHCESGNNWGAYTVPFAQLPEFVTLKERVDTSEEFQPLRVFICATNVGDDNVWTLYPPPVTYYELREALQWDSYISSVYRGVDARFEDDANGFAVSLPNVYCGYPDDRSPVYFSGTRGNLMYTLFCTYENTWGIEIKNLVDETYINNQPVRVDINIAEGDNGEMLIYHDSWSYAKLREILLSDNMVDYDKRIDLYLYNNIESYFINLPTVWFDEYEERPVIFSGVSDGKVYTLSCTVDDKWSYSVEPLTTGNTPFMILAAVEENVIDEEHPDGATRISVNKTYDKIWEAYNNGKQIKADIILGAGSDMVYGANVEYTPWGDKDVIAISGYGETESAYHEILYYPDGTLTYTKRELADKTYVDNKIGDIETALENIITKYGLGGDGV